jgi:hypothetical protein
VLPLELSILQQPVLTLNVSRLQQDVLSLDLSMLLQPVLLLDVSVLQYSTQDFQRFRKGVESSYICCYNPPPPPHGPGVGNLRKDTEKPGQEHPSPLTTVPLDWLPCTRRGQVGLRIGMYREKMADWIIDAE